MPRKKAEQDSGLLAEGKATITLTAEVSQELYHQILATAKIYGYQSVDEWLLDAIKDKV